MNLLQYVLLAFLVLLTLFNLYTLTIGRRKKKQAVASFKQTLAELENKTFKEMRKRQLNFSEKHGYINDLNEGILLTFDHGKKKVGITLKDAFYLIPFDSVLACKALYDTLDNGKWTNITVELETKDQVITLLFGSRSWKPKSTLGTFILADAQEFCSLVTKYCKEETEEPLEAEQQETEIEEDKMEK
ncbi:MAG: hypothetical protein RBR15_14680 [Sphaerochaeta sp.]|nr:hypothetical protein [Sphaerochaeta sp.]